MKINEQNLKNFVKLSHLTRAVLTPLLVTSSIPCALVFFAATLGTGLAINKIKEYNFIELENTKFENVLKISIIAASIILGIKTQNKLLPIDNNPVLAAATHGFFEHVIATNLTIFLNSTEQQDKSSTINKTRNLQIIFQNFGYLASLMFCPNLMVAFIASVACRTIPPAIEKVSRRFFQSQPQEA